jgi:hypothetical protein
VDTSALDISVDTADVDPALGSPEDPAGPTGTAHRPPRGQR